MGLPIRLVESATSPTPAVAEFEDEVWRDDGAPPHVLTLRCAAAFLVYDASAEFVPRFPLLQRWTFVPSTSSEGEAGGADVGRAVLSEHSFAVPSGGAAETDAGDSLAAAFVATRWSVVDGDGVDFAVVNSTLVVRAYDEDAHTGTYACEVATADAQGPPDGAVEWTGGDLVVTSTVVRRHTPTSAPTESPSKAPTTAAPSAAPTAAPAEGDGGGGGRRRFLLSELDATAPHRALQSDHDNGDTTATPTTAAPSSAPHAPAYPTRRRLHSFDHYQRLSLNN